MGKSQKNYMSIKSKLMAAVAMLLVASFMVVSSTYAWFTLSTAPEVTGIKTKIGANGSLEMALLYYNHETDAAEGETAFTKTLSQLLPLVNSGVGDSVNVKGTFESNKTWGNIVTLDLGEYGLDKVTLIPAALNATVSTDATTSKQTVKLGSGAPLYTPTYGSDGRVEALEATTLARLYNEGMYTAEGYGVRVLGTASGMAAHEIGHSNAKSTVISSLEKAKSSAQSALSEAAKTLSSMAVNQALGREGTYNITGLSAMFTNFDTANESLVDAMRAMFDAQLANIAAEKAAAANNGLTAGQWYTAASLALNKLTDGQIVAIALNDGTADGSATGSVGEVTITISASDLIVSSTMKEFADMYKNIVAQVASAKTEYDALDSTTNASYADTSDILNNLIKLDEVMLEGETVQEWKDKGQSTAMSDAFAAITAKGHLALTIGVTMADASTVNWDATNVFAKYAYEAYANLNTSTTVSATLTEGGDPMTVPAKMSTTVASAQMINLKTEIPAKPEADANEVKQLTDFYGYGIDLAFRTNAANSNLCLQTDPVGRIYSDGAQTTMGNGSNMKFTVDYKAWGLLTKADFEDPSSPDVATAFEDAKAANKKAAEYVANLASAIRIVFTDIDGNVVSFAKLAIPTTTTTTGEGESAVTTTTMDLSEVYNEETYELKLPIKLYDVTVKEETYVKDPEAKDENGNYTEAAYGEAGLSYTETTWDEKPTATSDNDSQVLMPLAQNTATALSVMVYLDGHVVDNSMVAANGAISMGGSLNLQFSSDADLTAMSYTPLQGGGSGTTTETEQTAAPTNP